jgi:hypothetical protein
VLRRGAAPHGLAKPPSKRKIPVHPLRIGAHAASFAEIKMFHDLLSRNKPAIKGLLSYTATFFLQRSIGELETRDLTRSKGCPKIRIRGLAFGNAGASQLHRRKKSGCSAGQFWLNWSGAEKLDRGELARRGSVAISETAKTSAATADRLRKSPALRGSLFLEGDLLSTGTFPLMQRTAASRNNIGQV